MKSLVLIMGIFLPVSIWGAGKEVIAHTSITHGSLNQKSINSYVLHDTAEEYFVALFDGSCKSDIASYCSKHVCSVFSQEKKMHSCSEDALNSTVEQLHKMILAKDEYNTSGATALLYYVDKKEKNLKARISWVGNIRALIINEHNKIIDKTLDHVYHNRQERTRIYNAGGIFKEYNSSLCVIGTGCELTRVLGLKESRNCYIQYSPESITVELKDPGVYTIVAATKGLWQQISNQQARDALSNLIKNRIDKNCADHLLLYAQEVADRGAKEKLTDSIAIALSWIVVQPPTENSLAENVISGVGNLLKNHSTLSCVSILMAFVLLMQISEVF